jgi:cytochrome c biogenesis protein CcdA/glutaredoxin
MLRYTHKLWLILPVLLGLLMTSGAYAAPASQRDADTPVFIYFFWGEGCPHCAQAKPFLEELTDRYPQVEVLSFEVYNSKENQELFGEFAASQGFEPRYVPTFFIGDQHWEGFSDLLRGELERAVSSCAEKGCPDAGAGIVPGHDETASPVKQPGAPEAVSPGATITLFWGDAGCADCVATQTHHATQSGFAQFGGDSGAEALTYLRTLEAEHEEVELKVYEVWASSTNGPRFKEMAQAYGFTARGIPTIFIGEKAWEGFYDAIAEEIEAYLEECLEVGCPDPMGESAALEMTPVAPTPDPTEEPTDDDATDQRPAPVTEAEPPAVPPASAAITLPILGTVDLGGQSLWVSTAIISFVDGFNPCSLWVLSVLIALSLRSGSRKRVFIIGLIYLTVTSLVYVLFIAGVFTFLTVVSFLGWIQVAVSLIALAFAAINIKDYFWYKEGVSLTISDEKKPGIYKRMRQVMNTGDSFWGLVTASAALGAGVSFVEFACTAGFPVIWSNLVASQGVAPITFVLLLALYMLIYLLDELAIFGTAVVTLKASRLEEKHGRILKLVGGILMLMLAVVMLVDPALMNDIGSSLLIFGGALLAAFVVLVIHRRLLPKLGVYIGSELKPQSE